MERQQANLRDHNYRQVSAWLKFLIVVIAIPLLGLAWVIFNIALHRFECVVLSNGSTIEYTSIWPTEYDYFWPSWLATDWPPSMTLRDAKGRILIKSNSSVRFLRVPSNPDMVLLKYGKKDSQEMRMFGRGIMPIVFDRRFSGKIWNEPKDGFPDDTSITTTDLQSIHHFLRDHETYRRRWCRSIWPYD